MPADHVVSSISEAVQLAAKWRANGTHTWFRGQTQPWSLLSSLGRRQEDPSAVDDVQARIGHYCSWAKDVPQLRSLLEEEHVHALFAVLQHDEVPTLYVDFTTEPDIAGFFAAHGPEAVPGTQGCVIAVDPDRLVDTLRLIAEVRGWQAELWPETVIVSVEDLWRMQAQSCIFLYLPVGNVERLYGYDRILFPHDSRPHPIAEGADLSSTQEQRGDPARRVLHRGSDAYNQSYYRELFEQWRSRGIRVRWGFTEVPDQAAYLLPGTGPHASWSSIDARWITAAGEGFHAATSGAPEVTLTIPAAETPETEATVLQDVQRLFTSWPECRTKPVRWIVVADAETSGEWASRLERVWDGMRRLPYSDKQLATTMAATLAISARHRPASAATTLELASERWVTSRASVDTARIRAAYREDLADVIRDPALADKPRLLLQVLCNTAYVFDFGKLIDSFAAEIIPSHVVRGRSDLTVFFARRLSDKRHRTTRAAEDLGIAMLKLLRRGVGSA
jgi:hypothetical protein